MACFDSEFSLLKFITLFWTFGRTPLTGNQPGARPLPIQDNTTQHRETQTRISMPPAGFEPTIPVFERSKTVTALYHAVIGTGFRPSYSNITCS
jgi:hypothetical protein